MLNPHIQAGRSYHEATRHSYRSVRTNPHLLDWANQPLPFKVYRSLDLIPLPRDFQGISVPALRAIAEVLEHDDSLPDLQTLSQLLYFSAGVTRRRTFPGGDIYFRAAACTGALYEIELYLACVSLPDLDAGLYHYSPSEFGLRGLRAGDFRQVLVNATANEFSIAHAPVIIICTGTYWRNAWKYQARTYRHFGWDNGTILANLLAVSTALELAAKLICGFIDLDINRLLDLDTEREVAFSLVSIGHVADLPPVLAEDISPLRLETVPLSEREVDYPAMRAMHEASSLLSPEEVARWRDNPIPVKPKMDGEVISLATLDDAQIPNDSIEQVIRRRGSTRQFAHVSISLIDLHAVCERTFSVPSAHN